MNFSKIKTFDRDRVHVVVESPMNSKVKYAYDPEMRVMKYEKELPQGLSFPFDFGFMPGTIGDDGDPLDILVLTNTPSLSGCVITCRLLGVLMAEQKEKGETIRNDRFLAVPAGVEAYEKFRDIHDLESKYLEQIEAFFINYNSQKSREFVPLKRAGKEEALKLIKRAMK
jgi:inorganic pyrophosphatase